jgi:hypothetical protein
VPGDGCRVWGKLRTFSIRHSTFFIANHLKANRQAAKSRRGRQGLRTYMNGVQKPFCQFHATFSDFHIFLANSAVLGDLAVSVFPMRNEKGNMENVLNLNPTPET